MNWNNDNVNALIHFIHSELSKGNQWLAYNNTYYRPNDDAIYFFQHKEEANDFAENNISEYDIYHVLNVS
jgi:hypothetical protein